MPQISGGTHLLDAPKILARLELTEGMKIADLGTGSAGHFTIPAAQIVGSKGIVYAVDILKSVLASIESRAKLERISNIQTVWSNLEIVGATRIPEASLDAVFLNNVLFQAKEDENLIKEARRLLKLDGKLLVVDWRSKGIPLGPPVIDRINPEEVKKLAQQAGLELVDEFEAGQYHFGLIFVKKAPVKKQ